MQRTSRPRILIAEDHALIAEAFNKLLTADFDVVSVVHDGRLLVRKAQELEPDVAIVDIGMPLLNGLQAGQRIKRSRPGIKLVYVSVNQDASLVAEAFRSGASAYLPKTAAGSELVFAIHRALNGETYVSPVLSDHHDSARVSEVVNDSKESTLTDRQLDVLQLLAEGKSMKEVGAVLNLTTRTVAFHKYRLRRHLCLENDAQVVQYALSRNIIFN
jgi:DNA-binding NarL/FixJ family response regulator